MGEAVDYIWALDAGGTKTAASLYSSRGDLIAKCRVGAGNVFHKADAVRDELDKAWIILCKQANLNAATVKEHTLVSGGFAGMPAPGAVEFLQDVFSDFYDCRLSSDGYTAFVGAFGAGSGCMVSAGTGMTGFVRGGDQVVHHASGWGFPCGDRGSGAYIGFEAMIAWQSWLDDGPLLSSDGLHSSDIMYSELVSLFSSGQGKVLGWLEKARAIDYAKLAPLVLDAASEGDVFAVEIVDRAAQHIANLVLQLMREEPLDLYLAGGIGIALSSNIAARLAPEIGHVQPVGDALAGALSIGLGDVDPEFV